MWNARIRIASIANAIDELAKYGPAKPEDLRGLSDVSETTVATIIRHGSTSFGLSQDTPLLEGQGAGAAAGSSGSSSTVKDPSGQRIGEPPEGKAMDTLIQVARDARDYIAAVRSCTVPSTHRLRHSSALFAAPSHRQEGPHSGRVSGAPGQHARCSHHRLSHGPAGV